MWLWPTSPILAQRPGACSVPCQRARRRFHRRGRPRGGSPRGRGPRPAGVPDRAAQALHSADFAASIRRAHNRGDDRPRPRPVPASQVAVASDAPPAQADPARDEADPELSARAAAAPDGAEESDFAELDRPAAPASGIRAPVSFGRRLAAAVVDAAVSGVVLAFFVLLGEVAWVASAGRVSPPIEALVLVYVLLGWLQAFLLDGLFGATLGKRLFGLRPFPVLGRPRRRIHRAEPQGRLRPRGPVSRGALVLCDAASPGTGRRRFRPASRRRRRLRVLRAARAAC